MTCVRTYRESMAEFSQMNTLELWYLALDADDLVASIKNPRLRKRALMRLQKERARSIAEDIFPKLVEHKGEMPLIKDNSRQSFTREGHPPGIIQKISWTHSHGTATPCRPPTGLCWTDTRLRMPPSK